jgi:aminoglycoside phosphotransferase (APT) family kinase protein
VDHQDRHVKRYADADRWKQAKEVHVYALLAAHGVTTIPEVVAVDEETATTTLTKVPGVTVAAAGIAPGAERGVYRQIGELLADIHRIPQPEFGYLTTELVDPEPHNTAYMTRQFRQKLAEFADPGGDREVHRLATERVAERSGLFGMCTGAVLCHNDLHEGNVLVTENGTGWRVTGFIDVENAIAADPLMDLAKTVQYDLTRSPAKFAGLVEGYGRLPASGLARIELYRLYHALELWDWFASVGTTAPLDGIAAGLRSLVMRSGTAHPS